jgi:hypothetical protein
MRAVKATPHMLRRSGYHITVRCTCNWLQQRARVASMVRGLHMRVHANKLYSQGDNMPKQHKPTQALERHSTRQVKL